MTENTGSSPLPRGLAELVARWLVENHTPDVAQVTGLHTYGTDWAGDTESGFYSEADTEVRYVKADGSAGYRHLAGEQLADLWQWIISNWPSDNQGSPA